MSKRAPEQPAPVVRCAIYARKSSDEGLDQAFNSLDAQRHYCEAYVTSRAAQGWICILTRFEDGGFSGATLERPAFKQLRAEIERGAVDVVVVYRADRISRSLLDFLQLLKWLEQHKVNFVSVSECFDTSQPAGRLMLHMVMSFAQYERELVSERTRDKIAATRRKGKWSGGHPLLGYDIEQAPGGSKLVVNELEAVRVREIFDLYLQHEALLPVARELEKRGWRNKSWITKRGRKRGGRLFDKCSLHKLLTNVAYIGRVRHKANTYVGEHAAIVDETFARVQEILHRNGRTGGSAVRNKYGALLKGILHCAACKCAMGFSYSAKNNSRRYCYYVCTNAQKRGWHTCPAPSVPAGEIERFVVDRIKAIGRDPALVARTISHARNHIVQQIATLQSEQAALERQVKRDEAELRRIAKQAATDANASALLAHLHERIAAARERHKAIRSEIEAAQDNLVDESAATEALARFDPVWQSLPARDQVRLVHLLIKRIDYDGAKGSITMTFHSEGLKSLCAGRADAEQEVAA